MLVVLFLHVFLRPAPKDAATAPAAAPRRFRRGRATGSRPSFSPRTEKGCRARFENGQQTCLLVGSSYLETWSS